MRGTAVREARSPADKDRPSVDVGRLRLGVGFRLSAAGHVCTMNVSCCRNLTLMFSGCDCQLRPGT